MPSNKMLIDAAHPEETRVVVLRGSRVEEFDFESASRRPLRGNIYLARVTRVEPSLQAAFIEYGGNRHGFLAFSEIHPDYYQIPVADRQALIEAEEAEIAEAEARQNERDKRRHGGAAEARSPHVREASGDDADDDSNGDDHTDGTAEDHDEVTEAGGATHEAHHDEDAAAAEAGEAASTESTSEAAAPAGRSEAAAGDDGAEEVHSDDSVESVGAEDALEELPERPERRRPRVRQYKIQEVIKRRQVLLVQVVKEERGNKGAALTTYLSLAGRYCVLMPNTARGGGISRKITSVTDRKRLKQVVSDLEVPQGMGVILRTAGAARTRAEVKRDFEYLLRLWENVRELTLRSSAPALVYEEGSLIKRSIRDLYNKDIDEVLVAGDDAYREAKDFMRMLMPSHAKNVQPYKDPVPLFARSGIEGQLDAMFSPQVMLRSGGYMVINQTEALVAIDVNSGRSTREHNIEDTAFQTNLEAAEEAARQLRLRDLAGLIVIDFIDMEEKRNNRSVERRLKEALKNDRARIQVGRISHFGLLEMSRQRIRTGVVESTTSVCPTCQGTGHVRAPSSVALHVLRALEDQLQKGVTHHLTIRTRTPVALYILNQKRAILAEIEERFGLHITVSADESIANGQHFVIERGEPVQPREQARASVTPASVQLSEEPEAEIEYTESDELAEEEAEVISETQPRGEGEREGGRRRRRRRGRRGGGERAEHGERGEFRPRPEQAAQPVGDFAAADDEAEGDQEAQAGEGEPQGTNEGGGEFGDDRPRRRRRGRRGGRRGRRGRGGEGQPNEEQQPQEPAAMPADRFDLGGDFDEIDTTPRLDDARADVAQRPSALMPEPPDEIDTTPQESQPARSYEPAHASEPDSSAEPDTTPRAEPEPEVDDGQPKRSGWWQRRSFFG